MRRVGDELPDTEGSRELMKVGVLCSIPRKARNGHLRSGPVRDRQVIPPGDGHVDRQSLNMPRIQRRLELDPISLNHLFGGGLRRGEIRFAGRLGVLPFNIHALFCRNARRILTFPGDGEREMHQIGAFRGSPRIGNRYERARNAQRSHEAARIAAKWLRKIVETTAGWKS